MNMSRNYFVAAIIVRGNDPCNTAMNFSSVAYRSYTRQRCVQLVLQRPNKVAGQVAEKLPSVTAPLLYFPSWKMH